MYLEPPELQLPVPQSALPHPIWHGCVAAFCFPNPTSEELLAMMIDENHKFITPTESN